MAMVGSQDGTIQIIDPGLFWYKLLRIIEYNGYDLPWGFCHAGRWECKFTEDHKIVDKDIEFPGWIEWNSGR